MKVKCQHEFTGLDPELAKAQRKFPQQCQVLVNGRGNHVYTLEWITRDESEDACPGHPLITFVRPEGYGGQPEYVYVEHVMRYYPPHQHGDTIRAVKASIEADPAARRRDENLRSVFGPKPRAPAHVQLPDPFDWSPK